LTALSCLGFRAERPFLFLNEYKDTDTLIRWLNGRDFGARVGWSGNEIMNLGTLLQYARDFHADAQAGKAASALLEWLSKNHINPRTGLWGSLDINDPVKRSDMVQAAYHWWALFLYDNYPIPYLERAIDSVLRTQNESGGFGWGVHNPKEPFNSSACEDIDSVDPLARFSVLTDYRHDDIRKALARAKPWILSNETADGGFVFVKGKQFEYGHPELLGNKDQGAMFPTWFRTLCLAVLHTAENHGDPSPFVFAGCPGFHFRNGHPRRESAD
jgi:hypothetical protein